ncbi:hypothetical protein V6N13_071284 [Hibiscus sabdariffa]|uniref:Uncharacterized protein n=1 Tax=Hibiscus sabdariffa TaxID=183260 RepID=A0ABR2TE79_9ROSI
MVVASNLVDVIKTMVMNMKVEVGQKPPYMGTLDCAMKTVKVEGPMALYKGFIPQSQGRDHLRWCYLYKGFKSTIKFNPDDVCRVREWDGESGKWLGLVVVVAKEEENEDEMVTVRIIEEHG